MEHRGKLELTWVGKYEETTIEPRILIEDPEKSYGDPRSENMLIHGDNLIALQALQQDYAGRIKCIYIDPPYNTGSAFEYYDDCLEHSIWLNLMRMRLMLLRDLLADDGFLCCQIDDSESHYVKVLLDEISFIRGENVFIRNYKPQGLIDDLPSRKAYIRGSFLGAGSVVDPKKSYHLEFVANNLTHAEFLQENVNYFNLDAKIAGRKDNYVIYLKESQAISDLLSLMGAHKSLLDFENTRVIKDMRNNINRIVNCETYNLNKIVKTSLDQVRDILYIKDNYGFNKLPKELREICELRLKDRDMSMGDMAKTLDPPISKSTVSYRLKKIKELASKLRGDIND